MAQIVQFCHYQAKNPILSHIGHLLSMIKKMRVCVVELCIRVHCVYILAFTQWQRRLRTRTDPIRPQLTKHATRLSLCSFSCFDYKAFTIELLVLMVSLPTRLQNSYLKDCWPFKGVLTPACSRTIWEISRVIWPDGIWHLGRVSLSCDAPYEHFFRTVRQSPISLRLLWRVNSTYDASWAFVKQAPDPRYLPDFMNKQGVTNNIFLCESVALLIRDEPTVDIRMSRPEVCLWKRNAHKLMQRSSCVIGLLIMFAVSCFFITCVLILYVLFMILK